MKLNEIINGFKVYSAVENEELGGILWKMEHIKTKAQLVWLDNNEENKLFSVSFKTVPLDDTGVFHILEHSVLCGSDNYPVKEPFLDLLKGSMNTFLNAFTFPDKTMYPVSSRNEKDFLNLTGVYLDAVFKPAIYSNKNIFYQEGWHCEYNGHNEIPSYKGVVFNEMKGAYSSVEQVVDAEFCKIIFKDNCYGCSSGGDPQSIPDLTCESFLDAHREFYHPTNAKFYLDGSLPIERTLELIESYLKDYSVCEKTHDIPLVSAVPTSETVKYYEIGSDENESQKTHMAFGKVVCSWKDKKKYLASEILAMYLTDNNSSPLKRGLLEDNLAQDVELTVNGGIAQVYSALRIKNSSYENREVIKQKISSVVEKLISQGLDREELSANINKLEFMLKETDEPKGIERAISATNAWLYGGEPEEYLLLQDTLASLRREIDTDYFTELLTELLLDTSHMPYLSVLPSKTEGERISAIEKERLKSYAETLDSDGYTALKELNEGLVAWQTEEDTPEALETLPKLEISDVSEKPAETPTEISVQDGIKVLTHKLPSNGITHLKYYFNLNSAELSELPLLSFTASMLGELPTENYSLSELKLKIKKYIGTLKFEISPFAIADSPDKCRLFLQADMSVLDHNLGEAVKLLAEILCKTRFDSRDSVRELLLQEHEDMYRLLVDRGNKFAALRTNRNFSAASAVEEKVSGYDMLMYLNEFSKNFDSEFESFKNLAEEFIAKTVNVSGLTLSVTSTDGKFDIKSVSDSLKNEKLTDLPEYFSPALSFTAAKEAIQIPAGVSFAALGSNLHMLNSAFSGKLQVLSSILTYGYLWTEIRVKGGAYGCGFNATRSGNVHFRTFRDPSPLNSLEVFKNTSAFIKGFVESGESVDRYIISSIANSEPLLSVSLKGAVADMLYFTEVSYEKLCKVRSEMLTLKKHDLLLLCEIFEKISENPSIAIVTNESTVSNLDLSWTVFKLQ